MKLGDDIVCIRECRMDADRNDKRTTIGKIYTIIKGYWCGASEEETWCIVDDRGEDHYFDNWNKYFRPVRKEKLIRLNELSCESYD